MAIAVEATTEQKSGLRRRLITLAEFDQMIKVGLFADIFRLELIRGELIEHMPPGQEHESCVARINGLFSKLVGDKALVWPQGNSIGITTSNSRPQPDITLLRWRDDLYAGKRPTPEDVILVIEVSLNTLNFDRMTKQPLYAEAGIAEYWLVNLVDRVIEVYKGPVDGKYGSVTRVQESKTIELPDELGGKISVADIIG
jgi:Uma2 family endonuclease